MQVNSVNNNKQSFGMAFRVNAESFAKASSSELEKINEIIDKAGKENLDKASQFVDSRALAFGIFDGKINSVIIAASPENLKGKVKQLFSLCSHMLFKKDFNVFVEPPYSKRIIMEYLTPESLYNAVESTSKYALKKFGNVKKQNQF